MLSGPSVIGIFCVYMGLLFCLALWTQRKARLGPNPVNNPLVYSLSLAVYCSSWTFFGGVGLAATHGLLFTAIYLGPTLSAVFWGAILRKMVLIKSTQRITSIADFISTRYDKSESLAALVTFIVLVGCVPYVALQIKAVLATFAVITQSTGETQTWINAHVGAIVVGLMILFTIVLGVRRLIPTERHEGIVMAVAVESIVKLVALLAVGIYVVYYLNDGFDDILLRAANQPLSSPHLGSPMSVIPFSLWVSYLLVSANAVLFLPRQFHVAVVENQSPRHIRYAIWLFPLYLFMINLFIYPIALAGLQQGLPIYQADTFILRLPLIHGHKLMALLVFIGGFSATTSMILICSMTLATMISNHLLLPLGDRLPRLAFIQRHLLQCRWLAVGVVVSLGYCFEQAVGERFRLADIGMISFVAILQLAPALIGGLYWRSGNKTGAFSGLIAGFLVWSYTMLLPAMIRSTWPSATGILDQGPWGMGWLRPEQLFGLSDLDPEAHTIFWSFFFNAGGYVLGSLLGNPSQESISEAEAFVGVMAGPARLSSYRRRMAIIPLMEKRRIINELLSRYFEKDQAAALMEKCFYDLGLSNKKLASIVQLAELYHAVETALGASIGAASAHRTLARSEFYNQREAEELRSMYADILAGLRARPEDLMRRIDYYQESETLVMKHALELEEKITALEKEIAARQVAEAQLSESEERYRLAIEYSSDGIMMIKDEKIIWGNTQLAKILGYRRRSDVIDLRLAAIVHPDDRERVLTYSRDRQSGRPAPSRYDFKGLKKDGTPLYIAVSATAIWYHGEMLNMVYIRDVTRRRLAEDEIRNLSRRLIVGIEDERRRLAADLHDEFGQALTGLHLQVDALLNSLSPDQGDQKIQAVKLMKMIEQLAESLRNICGELRPDMLDHLGLVSTVGSFIKDYRERLPNVEIEFEAVGFKNKKISPQAEISLYRILQEALNNAVKHSGAGRAVVKLTYSYPNVIMVVSDDGRGFEMDQPWPTNVSGKRGIGLVSMKERAAAAGGSLEVRSQTGKGTTIRVTIPAGVDPVWSDDLD
ncbi:MAG: PAS domain S-box protein [Deltaproteobacteria bacterium]|nr:PAS domain S-box protein [Deltaproteobacteria bacterium]